jgi:hypothetical protein
LPTAVDPGNAFRNYFPEENIADAERGQVVASELVVARCDASKVLQPVDRALDTLVRIRECVDLRVAPAARAANSLFLSTSFPAAAERCAFTCVESIIYVSADRPPSSQFAEQVLLDPALRPACEAVIDRRGSRS